MGSHTNQNDFCNLGLAHRHNYTDSHQSYNILVFLVVHYSLLKLHLTQYFLILLFINQLLSALNPNRGLTHVCHTVKGTSKREIRQETLCLNMWLS
ncbi:hypothetical protein VCRA219O19_220081 [Vibrio crassostreae]|nr:hypothetical protein VCRA219O19_220081 [Vibrio crassostreae]